MLELDALMISDFRLPGGTNHSNAQELAVHKEMGLRTGLVHCNSRLSSESRTRIRAWAPVITDALSPQQAEPVMPATSLHAQVALLRHPTAAESMPDLRRHVRVDQALMIANQAAVRPDGSAEYDVVAITKAIRRSLGVTPTWAPIGPVVRQSLESFADDISLLPYDWNNIIALRENLPVRRGFDAERPRIGRHSRPQGEKWPEMAEDIVSAYPVTENYSVSILGGASPAIDTLGYRPASWTIHGFGSMAPMDFLREIDFWVYYHRSDMFEAFGRAIMEALWSGAVVILPEYLRITYGDAAVYGRPSDVRHIIDEFCTGRRDFFAQSARGQHFARAHGPDVHADRMRTLLANPQSSTTSTPVTARTPEPVTKLPSQHLETDRKLPVSRLEVDKRPRALFVTSNGNGMGHLTRMLGLARIMAEHFSPVFFSMSQGVNIVSAAGFPYEYVPYSSAIGTTGDLWHAYLNERILEAIDHYDAQIVLFDGTAPYRGMLAAFTKRDVMSVWIRRGMWKPHIGPYQLTRAPHFDVIIEPGEHAHDYDLGETTRADDAAVPVAPMTVLSASELLPREQARAELGLSDDPDRKLALVTLGVGNAKDLTSTLSTVLAAIQRHQGWETILTKAPISVSDAVANSRTISTFPLSRYTHAFDFAVSANGYNSFAEWMTGALPTIWIPNTAMMTDDQDARARWAADVGYGLRALGNDTAGIHEAVDRMCDDSTRSTIAQRLAELGEENGTTEAARLVLDAWRARQHGTVSAREDDPAMMEAVPPEQIVPHNALLEGISDKAAMPTILLHFHGLPPFTIEAEAAEVGMLQAVSPTFRIVLFTEFPVFQSLRRFGWPVEHVSPPEHQARIASVTSHQRYVAQRVGLVQRHYHNTTVVHVDGASPAVDQIAELIGRPELAALAHSLSPAQPSEDVGESRWDVILDSLRSTGAGHFTSAEGDAHIYNSGPLQGAIIVTGASQKGRGGHPTEKPDWVSSIVVEFGADSSLAFESHVYASLSRLLGVHLAIILPRRRPSALSEDVLHWVDLAVEASTSGFCVLSEYLEMYELLTGSAMLEWHQARRYAAARRLSRTVTKRRVT